MQNLMWWENPMTNKNSKTKTAAKEMQRIRIKRNQRAQKQDGCEEETITETGLMLKVQKKKRTTTTVE